MLTRTSKDIMRYEGTDECLILGIERFPAGHWGLLRNGELTRRRWWCTLDALVEVPDSFEAQAELFRETFFDACRLRMRSDVPLGTALSGGLDSSAVISCRITSYNVCYTKLLRARGSGRCPNSRPRARRRRSRPGACPGRRR